MPVDTASDTYEAFVTKWQRARDCYEGSDAVKEQGAGYLPPLASHGREPAKYEAYKQRALFYNATGRTVDGLAGLIFQKEPKRWTPSFGQVCVAAKVESGFMIQAALGLRDTGRSPGLLSSAPSSMYASSGVRSWSDECGRHSL